MSMFVDDPLGKLEAAGLVRAAAAPPDSQYIFSQTLVREAAYSSLLHQDRRRLHREVGLALEAVYPDRRDDLAAVLAHHFSEAGDDERALRYFTLAGSRDRRRHALDEAIAHYKRAVEIAERSASVAPDQIRELAEGLGRCLEIGSRWGDALAVYERLEHEGVARGEPTLVLAGILSQALVRTVPNPQMDLGRAAALLDRAESLAAELGDRAARARCLWNRMLRGVYAGEDPVLGVERGEAAAALARELGLRERLAYALNDLSSPYWATGQIALAIERLREARVIFDELSLTEMRVDNLSRSALLHLGVGDLDESLRLSDAAYDLGRRVGSLSAQAYSRFLTGHVYLERGDPDRAVATMRDVLALAERVGHPPVFVGARAELAQVYGLLGDDETAVALARQGTDDAARFPNLRSWPWAVLSRLLTARGDLDGGSEALAAARRYLVVRDGALLPLWAGVELADAELELARGDAERSLVVTDALLDRLRRAQARPYLVRALHQRARALVALEREAEAETALTQARDEAAAMGCRTSLWPVLALLSDVVERRGDPFRAWTLRRTAREIVAGIAANIAEPTLRAAFLNREPVRRLGVG